MRRKYGENAEKVFQSIKANLFIKTHEIAGQIQLSQRTVDNAILKLKKVAKNGVKNKIEKNRTSPIITIQCLWRAKIISSFWFN